MVHHINKALTLIHKCFIYAYGVFHGNKPQQGALDCMPEKGVIRVYLQDKCAIIAPCCDGALNYTRKNN